MCRDDVRNANETYKSASYFDDNAFTVKTLKDTGLNVFMYLYYTLATSTTTCMASFLLVSRMEFEGDNASWTKKINTLRQAALADRYLSTLRNVCNVSKIFVVQKHADVLRCLVPEKLLKGKTRSK